VPSQIARHLPGDQKDQALALLLVAACVQRRDAKVQQPVSGSGLA
jgi:hypothetical protein